jgi:L-seryl-tRNA(Ser) seleniumtransferase
VADTNSNLRKLPSVDEVLRAIGPTPGFPHGVVVGEIRRVVDRARTALLKGDAADDIAAQVREALAALERPSLRRVINATGVVLHTNLGRAPLSEGYCNLEYDLAAGARGKRDVHIAGLIERLTGKSGIAVNNNAAAVYLALNELACGYEVIVSRGELIEIGDGFRIPDIMRSAGVTLREVGTTNRTSIDDYRNAITDRTRLLLRVHPSNFHVSGFTAKPDLRDLSALAEERGIPFYEDLGSGCLADLGLGEPLAGGSIAAGVNLVSFSGDKLLGGPQAGILAGDAGLIARLRRNPMFRALRLDKLIYHSLEETLRNLLLERYDRIPALRMIRLTAAELKRRAEELAAAIGGQAIPGESVIGGGSTPDRTLPAWLVAVSAGNPVELEAKLRGGDPPIVVRIEKQRILLDVRTVQPEEEAVIIEAFRALRPPADRSHKRNMEDQRAPAAAKPASAVALPVDIKVKIGPE